MFNVGVWVQLPPGANWSGEGLTRLLSFVAEGADPDNVRLKLLVPRWMREEIAQDVKSWGENSKRVVEIVTAPGKLPFAARYHLRQLSRQGENDVVEHKPSLRSRFLGWIRRTWKGPGRILLLIGGIVTAPVWIVAGLVVSPALAIVKSLFGHSIWGKIGAVLASPFRELLNARNQLRSYIANALPGYVSDTEFEQMARYGNRMDVDVWYVGYPGFTTAKRLKAPIVVMFADFVVGEFPHLFPPAVVSNARTTFAELVPHASKYITISRHVAEKFAIGQFGIARENVITIPHAPPSLAVNAPYLPSGVYRTDDSRRAAADVIRAYCAAQRNDWPVDGPLTESLIVPYLQDFPFEDIDFLLVSTQNRPYKNTIAAVKAVEHLVRNRNRNIKVFMTGNIGIDIPNSIDGKYLRERKLHHHAISIPRVPRDVHAALYHCALAAIQPTFYEGGAGSWIFFEALSVGTPALISRNPSSLEMDFDKAFKRALFNPADIGEISDQIEAVMDGREALYRQQCEWCQQHLGRTWNIVSKEYFDVFREASLKRSR